MIDIIDTILFPLIQLLLKVMIITTVCESMHFRRFCTYSQNMIFSESYFKFPLLLTDTHHMDFYYNWI